MKKKIYLLLLKLKVSWYDIKNVNKAALVCLKNKNGKILCVSRKNNKIDFGLCGGKVDKGEKFEVAAIRELYEETGLIGFNLKPVFIKKDNNFICVTYVGNFSGEILTNESGEVRWLTFEDLKKGSFGKYNSELEKILINLNIY